MSLVKSNYPNTDMDKNPVISKVSQDQQPLTTSRKYNIKKIPDLTKEHTNQNNTLYDENRKFRHRNHEATDMVPQSRYKSYDYLPARRPTMDLYRNTQYNRREDPNDFSDSGLDFHEASHDDLHKFRKSYSYGGGKMFSSNEELDNSRNYDVEANHSSDSSRRYHYRPGQFVDRHNDYHRNSRYTDFENRKYGSTDWNYESLNKFQDPKRYSRFTPASSKFTKSPGPSKVKHNLRGTSYPSYINNNRSDVSPRQVHNTQLTSDIHRSRYADINNDNYSSHRKEVPNRNMLSLKSTYRKNENVPHSGTRLENHRKELDKYCSGRSRGTRFDESNNCEDSRRNNSMSTNRSSKPFRTTLPPSPKYTTTRKKYGENMKNPAEDKYFNRDKFSTPHRPKKFPREPISDNESCFFENCHNTNK